MGTKRSKSSGVLYATNLMVDSAQICIPSVLRLTLANIIVSDVHQVAAGSYLSKPSLEKPPQHLQSQDSKATTQGPTSTTPELKKAPKCFNKQMKFSLLKSPSIMNKVTTMFKTCPMIFIQMLLSI